MSPPFIQQPPCFASVQVASNANPSTAIAIKEILEELGAEKAQLTLIFYGSNHDDRVLAHELDRVTGARGIAGTTAGELNSQGFDNGTISGISFHGTGVRAAVEIVPQLRELSLIPIVHLPDKLARNIERKKSDLDPSRHLWMFLLNGDSGKEDLLTPFFMNAAPRVNLVGATLSHHSGDNGDARLIHHGRVYRDAAATVLLEYDGPFEAFHHTHVTMTERRLEVTRTRRDGRRIEQLNGRRALDAYAEALDMTPDQVTPEVLASHPLGYRFRGQPFPISIGESFGDGSLRVASTVQDGQMLYILETRDLVESTRERMASAISRVEPNGASPHALLIFQCRLRDIEARKSGQSDALAQALCQGPLCGLNSNGEQFATMHLNHSMTGVVFGSGATE